MRQQSTTSTYILTDASTVYNKYIYLLMLQHSLQQIHISTDTSTVYSKYIYLLMRQHSLQQVHTLTDASTVYKYIYLLMHMHSLQQVHMLTEQSTTSVLFILYKIFLLFNIMVISCTIYIFSSRRGFVDKFSQLFHNIC